MQSTECAQYPFRTFARVGQHPGAACAVGEGVLHRFAGIVRDSVRLQSLAHRVPRCSHRTRSDATALSSARRSRTQPPCPVCNRPLRRGGERAPPTPAEWSECSCVTKMASIAVERECGSFEPSSQLTQVEPVVDQHTARWTAHPWPRRPARCRRCRNRDCRCAARARRVSAAALCSSARMRSPVVEISGFPSLVEHPHVGAGIAGRRQLHAILRCFHRLVAANDLVTQPLPLPWPSLRSPGSR